MRLWAGKTGSGNGAGRMFAQAIAPAVPPEHLRILGRGDSAYGSRAVVGAYRPGARHLR